MLFSNKHPAAGPLNSGVRHVKFLLFLLLVLSLAINTASADSVVTPESVMSGIKKHGAKAMIKGLWSPPYAAGPVLEGIRSGDVRWIGVARALYPSADAGAAEELNEAIAHALLVRPYDVLPWLSPLWWKHPSRVCVFAADSELPGGALNYAEKLRAALSKPPPAGQVALRRKCLAGLEHTRKTLLTNP